MVYFYINRMNALKNCVIVLLLVIIFDVVIHLTCFCDNRNKFMTLRSN